jgi:hypothetical protein
MSSFFWQILYADEFQKQEMSMLSSEERIEINRRLFEVQCSSDPLRPGSSQDTNDDRFIVFTPIAKLIFRDIPPNGASYEIDCQLIPPESRPGEITSSLGILRLLSIRRLDTLDQKQ